MSEAERNEDLTERGRGRGEGGRERDEAEVDEVKTG